jgi:SDR family mycofactocin-dependent oxidoreductase
LARLEGKVALITGAARGQGRAHALRLAEEGADIVALDIAEDASRDIGYLPYEISRDEDLEKTVARVEGTGRRAIAARADVRSQEQLDAAVERGVSELGKIDILVANAGIVSMAPFWEMSEEMWGEMIDINLSGVWRSAKALAPHMMERRAGAIVMTASQASFEPTALISHYASAKHGVIGLMRNVALELAPHDVRCNAVCPGAIDTAMINNPRLYELFAGGGEPTREVALESTRHYNLLNGRSMLPPEAVSNAVLWLVSGEAEHVTGVALPVDAGHTILPGYNPNPTR